MIKSAYRIQYENKFISRDYPLLFIDCETEEQKYGTSFTNEEEAHIVLDLVKHLGKMYDKNKFGFVSPYQGQVQKLKACLTELELQDNVRTIDSWQGREKEYMIFSAVRCNQEGNVGFLENERRTNVALTRAQHGLIIVGNARTLVSDPKWETLIEFFKIKSVFVEGGLSGAIQRINQLTQSENILSQMDCNLSVFDDDIYLSPPTQQHQGPEDHQDIKRCEESKEPNEAGEKQEQQAQHDFVQEDDFI